ncbi:Stomatal closure-related actin-binding protein 3 [Citrus sinensis]|nr:stomatal closure-related actin-binding protein 3-like isoform X1 [Citrus sinensis]XP_006482053.1 stomatal closure-related actin-binding protein 3-like isoform X1 [Citrus sinensis]XP_024955985.1 stomatal closure-related actin-binding protein 3-like isoform X1 [Citrus sinensis]KAH9675276.1 Stomatal closure-related actin-binding protein 3 [Citrus sinensis]
MTKISPEIEEDVQAESLLSVSADVSFSSNCFPKYKLGPDNQIVEESKEDSKGLSLKEVVEKETVQLSEQHKRLSVRDLASKFDKNLTAAAKLADEAKLRDVASLEGHVLLKKLRDALEALRGRMAGRTKEDVEKAISLVEALAVKLTQNEGELIQEKFEVKKLANFLKQASEDAKKLVNQEKSFACAEIESARAVVQRFGEALEEEEKNSPKSKTQDVERLVDEIQEARRIKRLHQPSKVMDMEHELHALRTQIREKSVLSLKIQKELAMNKRAEENKSCLYVFDGSEALGSHLRIRPRSDTAPSLSKCSIQWYRVSLDGSQKEIISGASKLAYAPEPLDVGRVLQADILSNGQKITVTSVGPIESAAGLGSYVETLLRKSSSEFNVVISQMNGQDYLSHSNHCFNVGKLRIKLCRGWITKSREIYHTSMQLCGVRGDSNAAAKSLFWQARKGLSYVLTFESEKERNAAIMIARKHALDCNIMLAGPDDQV